ncbi:MAG TPA: beta-propeller fold lactonase family protein [Chitinophagaceae bacterium]
MKRTGLAIAVIALLFAACKKDTKLPPPADELQGASAKSNRSPHDAAGHVYTMSNDPGSNMVLDYLRAADGTLTLGGSYATGGTGTGTGLGNQGAVIFADGGDVLLVVNPGSNTISSFKITPAGLNLKSVVNSGGVRPVSLTSHDDLVYVLNQGGNGSISGFRLRNNDKLEPIPNSTRPLSVPAPTDPAQISFVLGGKALVITEKATNTITTYTVNHSGTPGVMHTMMSSTPTPFGFDTGTLGLVFVSEAAGGAPGASALSSYRVLLNGEISLVEGSVSAGQTAACWVVIKDGKYAYTTNTGSNNISNFDVNIFSGNIGVNDAVAAMTQAGPIDAALSRDSRYLYVLTSMGHTIDVFAAAANGDLTHIQTVPGLPPAANGLAAK